ncbi:MAG: VOC family protein [Clostridia bacterium]|nr:VOC family protein [Clostridia bacterium]
MSVSIGHTIYVKGSVKAVPFYQEVFGLTLGYHVKNADGSFFHSELHSNEHPVLSVVEAFEERPFNNLVCLGMTLDSADAVLRAFALLRDGGTIRMPLTTLPWSPCCAEVVDRYGVWWYLTAPQHKPGDDFDPDTFEYERS